MADSNRKPRDSIGLIAALIASLIVGVLVWNDASTQQASYEIEAKDHAADYGNAARVEAQKSCISAKPALLQGCVEEGARTARPEQRQEYDLEAQRIMAVWTRAMGIAAVIGMAVGILGVGLIFVTFQETRRAADQARRAADQAEQTRLSYLERERGHLRVLSAQAWRDRDRLNLQLRTENIGASMAIISGLAVDLVDYPAWRGEIDGDGISLQVKVAADGTGYVSAGLTMPALLPCYAIGFLRYRTLGEPDARCYFSFEIEQAGNDLTTLRKAETFLPDDT